jgi:hypothetical protein
MIFINDIRLNEYGYRVGSRVLELLAWREKVAKREIKVINVLYFIHSTVWKALFGKQADSLEKSTENEDECKISVVMFVKKQNQRICVIDMISDNEPILTRYISVPKELSQLNCNAFVAGIVEAVLDGCQFVSIMIMVLLVETKFIFDSLRA